MERRGILSTAIAPYVWVDIDLVVEREEVEPESESFVQRFSKLLHLSKDRHRDDDALPYRYSRKLNSMIRTWMQDYNFGVFHVFTHDDFRLGNRILDSLGVPYTEYEVFRSDGIHSSRTLALRMSNVFNRQACAGIYMHSDKTGPPFFIPTSSVDPTRVILCDSMADFERHDIVSGKVLV